MISSKERKALFFDVDGTLISEMGKYIPESTVKALGKAMEKGHMVFINSGRTYCLLDFLKKEIPVDGFLCGCGTQIIVHGESRFHKIIDRKRGREIKEAILACNLDGCLEAETDVYFQRGRSRIETVRELKHRMVHEYGLSVTYGWEEDCYDYDKFCVFCDENSDVERFLASVPEMEAIDRGEGMYECVPRGCSKGTAVEWVLKEYGISLDHAYVFGDSTNDIPMFSCVPNRIAMGVHAPELLAFQPFVTKTVEDGGIAYAMEQLGII